MYTLPDKTSFGLFMSDLGLVPKSEASEAPEAPEAPETPEAPMVLHYTQQGWTQGTWADLQWGLQTHGDLFWERRSELLVSPMIPTYQVFLANNCGFCQELVKILEIGTLTPIRLGEPSVYQTALGENEYIFETAIGPVCIKVHTVADYGRRDKEFMERRIPQLRTEQFGGFPCMYRADSSNRWIPIGKKELLTVLTL